MNEHLETIILVGRPNVGKSTLFNRLLRRRQAIEDSIAGTTRDPVGSVAELAPGKAVWVVDTAGDEAKPLDQLIKIASEKRRQWLQDAAHILVLFDAREGITGEDDRFIRAARRTGKPFTLVAACADNDELKAAVAEYGDTFGVPVFPVSAIHNKGVKALREHLLPLARPYEAPRPFGVVLIGRPNAGKSTLFNRLIGSETAIVSAVPGTTRDVLAFDEPLPGTDETVRFYDTAGMARRSQMMKGLLRYATFRLEDTLALADVALLCVDPTAGGFHHETRLAQKATKEGLSIVLLVTKWDLMGDADQDEWLDKLRTVFHFIPWAPVIFVSAQDGLNIDPLWHTLLAIRKARSQRITDAELKDFVEGLIDYDKRLRALQKIEQLGTNPPRFIVVLAMPIHLSLKRQVQNRLREHFELGPTPVICQWRAGRARRLRREYR